MLVHDFCYMLTNGRKFWHQFNGSIQNHCHSLHVTKYSKEGAV